MKNILPELAPRSISPSKIRIKLAPLSSLSPKKSRHQSNSPKLKSSNDSFSNFRTVSDELKSTKSSQNPIFIKLNQMLSDLDKKSLKFNFCPRVIKSKLKLHSDIVNALFNMTKSQSEVTISSLIGVFLGLGYSADYDSLSSIFRSMSVWEFSKNELISILQDNKIDNMLRVLLKEYKDSGLIQGNPEFDCLVGILKKWWTKLDLSKNGFVSTESVCKFLISLNLFESSAEVKKVFGKLPPFINQIKFFGVFAKALLKFLLLTLCDDARDRSFVPADITLNARRRKLIIGGLIGENKTVDALIQYNINK